MHSMICIIGAWHETMQYKVGDDSALNFVLAPGMFRDPQRFVVSYRTIGSDFITCLSMVLCHMSTCYR